MDVSVILVNYNTKELTRNCINSVFEKTTGIDFEIIVSDNGSKDGSVEMLKEEFKQVKLIENNANLGFGTANNRAIEQSKGKYVFLLNTDTVLVNNAIKILFDFMEENPNCGGAGGNLYDKDMNEVHAFGYGDDLKSLILKKTPLKFLFLAEYLKIKKYEKKRDKSKFQQVRHITGADLMLRKETLDKCGFFNEDFFLYFEENELEHRIKKSGYEIWFVPTSKIIHLEGKSTNPMRDIFFTDGFVKFYKYSYGEFWGKVAKFLLLPRILKAKFLLKTKKR